MIRKINESKTTAKDISCDCKCKFYRRKCIQINGEIMINIDVSVKNIICVKKINVWNPATCNCENGKYFASIIDKIICDEITDVKETNFNEKKYKF